jgi:hypothetical protein
MSSPTMIFSPARRVMSSMGSSLDPMRKGTD